VQSRDIWFIFPAPWGEKKTSLIPRQLVVGYSFQKKYKTKAVLIVQGFIPNKKQEQPLIKWGYFIR
jgi:hypothetical protein